MSKDSLGDRIKRYEAVSKPLLSRRTPVLIRVDGKAFHTFTRGCEKPYDAAIIRSMTIAAANTAKHMQGFKLAYVQSDEATFLLTDYDTLETDAWFDYELNKLVSITASMFTYYFRQQWEVERKADQRHDAFFDARAFNVPRDDWPNAFIWRQRDWERNSVQMLARSLYSQKELQGKNVEQLHELIRTKGHDWESMGLPQRWGTFIKQDGHLFFGHVDYNKLVEMAGSDA